MNQGGSTPDATGSRTPTPRARVLHVRVANFYGGPERQLHLHALESRAGPFEVRVATFAPPGVSVPWLERFAADGISCARLPARSAYDFRSVGRLRALLREEEIDVVCSHDYRSALLTALARGRTRAAWIAFSRGLTRENAKVRAFQWAADRAMRRADAVVAVSAGEAASLDRRGVPPGRIRVVRNAVDVTAFERVPPLDLRTRHALGAEHVICLSAGRFSPEKGQALLVEAARVALAARPDLRFLLLGDGPDLSRIREAVRRAGLEGRVLCPGFEPEVVACMRGADLLVLPSLSEGLPNVVLEAMAVGLPVVATAVGGVPELVVDGRTGLCVPPAKAGALARAILAVAADRAGAAARAAAARERLRAEFTFPAQGRALRAVYGEVLLGRRA